MLIPQLTTLRVEDFPKQRDWIGKLLFPLNQFLLSATTAINGNMTLGDNIPCQTTTIQIVSVGGSGDFPKSFKWNLISAPKEIRVCQATENGTGIALVIGWDYSNGLVYLRTGVKLTSSGVSGLTEGATYNIVIRGQI